MYQLAVTEERERRQLAAELHDYLAQLLTLARIKIKQAQQTAYPSVADCNRYIVETDDLLHKSLDYVRTLMAELYPAQLHELGLPAALHWLAGQMPRHGLEVEVTIGGMSLSLTSEKELLVYQSVRELLLNIVKHTGVTHASVVLENEAEWLSVIVQDHGRGFDPLTLPATALGQHFGLQSVRERIISTGGTFAVDSSVGKGTTIMMTVPSRPSSQLALLRAASASRQDRVKSKPAGPQDLHSLTL